MVAPKGGFVILSVAKNLVRHHPNNTFICNRVSQEKGNVGVEDEILRYAQNDKVHLWVPLSHAPPYVMASSTMF